LISAETQLLERTGRSSGGVKVPALASPQNPHQKLRFLRMRFRCSSCSLAMVDGIVQLRDGRWGTIEIKLGEGQVVDAATNLERFAEQVDS